MQQHMSQEQVLSTLKGKQRIEIVETERTQDALKHHMEEQEQKLAVKFKKIDYGEEITKSPEEIQKLLSVQIRPGHVLALFQQFEFYFTPKLLLPTFSRYFQLTPERKMVYVRNKSQLQKQGYFRGKRDAMYKARGMQKLLNKIKKVVLSEKADGLYDSGDYVRLLYQLVKLRFPERELIEECIIQVISQVENLDTRQLAVVCWCLGRLDYQNREITETLMLQVARIS